MSHKVKLSKVKGGSLVKDKQIWVKPEIETLGSAQELIDGLGGGKEPGPTDNQIVDVNIEFS